VLVLCVIASSTPKKVPAVSLYSKRIYKKARTEREGKEEKKREQKKREQKNKREIIGKRHTKKKKKWIKEVKIQPARLNCNILRVVMAISQILGERQIHNIAVLPPIHQQYVPQHIIVVCMVSNKIKRTKRTKQNKINKTES
jgi:hypothetical protein